PEREAQVKNKSQKPGKAKFLQIDARPGDAQCAPRGHQEGGQLGPKVQVQRRRQMSILAVRTHKFLNWDRHLACLLGATSHCLTARAFARVDRLEACPT